jgi:hypothetical protein
MLSIDVSRQRRPRREKQPESWGKGQLSLAVARPFLYATAEIGLRLGGMENGETTWIRLAMLQIVPILL